MTFLVPRRFEEDLGRVSFIERIDFGYAREYASDTNLDGFLLVRLVFMFLLRRLIDGYSFGQAHW